MGAAHPVMQFSVEIFEQFGFLVFAIEPQSGLVQFKGTRSTEAPASLRESLRAYSASSRREVFSAWRNNQSKGDLLLVGKPGPTGGTERTELMWRFDAATGLITGMLRNLGTRCAFSHSCPDQQQSLNDKDMTLVQIERDRLAKAGGKPEYKILPNKVLSSSLNSASERLVQLNVALEGAKLGFWDWNRSNNMLLVNTQWASLIGCRTEEVRGADFFFERIHPDDKPLVEQALARYIQGRSRMYTCDFRLRHANGKYVHIQAVGAFQVKRTVAGQKEMHMVGIHRDRTEEVLREGRLRDLVKQSKDQLAAKSQFLANVSHEIRTPVHGLLNLVQMARSQASSPVQIEHLDAALDTSRALGFKLDGLVDFASLDTVPLLPRHAKARLVPLFDLARRYYWNALQEKGVAFEMDIDPRLTGVYQLDEKLVVQVLLGFLDNAVKFTSTGSVRVDACLVDRNRRVDEDDCFTDTIEIRITDSGAGMGPQQLADLFSPYSNLNNGRDKPESGIGYGLGLVKACVKALSGEVLVDSELGYGTNVMVRLYLRGFDEQARTSGNEPENSLPVLDRLEHVLVVDDVSLNRMILRNELESLGIKVQEAADGLEVLDLFRTRGFQTDLVLMDVQMPKMDGITATRNLRQQLQCKVPVIGITADATQQTEQDGLDAGMDKMLFKPVDVTELIQNLRRSTHRV